MITVQITTPCTEAWLDYLNNLCSSTLSCGTGEDQREICFAVNEILINSIEATKNKTKDQEGNYFLTLSIQIVETSVEIVISDQAEGKPAEIETELNNKTFEDVLWQERGRGLLFVQNLVDELWFDKKGVDFITGIRKEINRHGEREKL